MEGETAGIEHTVAIGHRHIAEQEERIARQQATVEKLTREGHDARAADARQMLSDMRVVLSQMQRDLCSAQQRLRECSAQQRLRERKASANAASEDDIMDKVTRDCPL